MCIKRSSYNELVSEQAFFHSCEIMLFLLGQSKTQDSQACKPMVSKAHPLARVSVFCNIFVRNWQSRNEAFSRVFQGIYAEFKKLIIMTSYLWRLRMQCWRKVVNLFFKLCDGYC